MSDAAIHLLLPYILAAQAQKHVTHNEALRILDGFVQLWPSNSDGRIADVAAGDLDGPDRRTYERPPELETARCHRCDRTTDPDVSERPPDQR